MLWRVAPLRLLRAPGWSVLVLVAVTLFVASVVAPSLFVASARSTALAEGTEAAAGAAYGNDSPDLRVIWDAVLPPKSEALLQERIAALPGYADPTLGAAGVGQSRTRQAVVRANGRTAPAELWYHDGAVAALGGDEADGGVWLPADTAGELGLEVGDRLRIGMAQTFLGDSAVLAPTVLAGTYETEPGSALPTVLADDADAERWFLPPDPDDPGGQSPVAIAGRAAFDRLVLRTHDSPLYLSDLRLDPDITPEGAVRAVEALEHLADDAYDASDPLASRLADGEPVPAQLQVLTGLPDIVLAADSAAVSAGDQVRPYAVAGQVLAGALLIAAWVLLGRSRRREQLLASGVGLRPVEVGALAALEVLPVVLVGAAAGLGLACLGVLTAGPPTEVGIQITRDDLVRAVAAAGIGLALVALTAGLAAAGTDRSDRLSRLGRTRRALPWTAALLAATVAVAVAVLTVDVVDRSDAPLTMAFPVLVAASVAVLVARTAGWVRARRPGRARAGSARWLATRRAGPVLREVVALTVVIAVALGLFAYALTVHRGIDQGVDDKTAALAGAATTIEVAEDFRGGGMRRAVTPPVDGSTIVWRRSVALPPDRGDEPLMAIDPATFDGVADWGASGDLEAARSVLPRLDRRAQGLPVVLVGTTDMAVGDEGTLDFNSEFQIPFEVVAVVSAFPGSETEAGDVTVVASARRLFRLVFPTIDPRRKRAESGDPGAFTSTVWSADSGAGLRRSLQGAGVTSEGELATATDARISAGLVAATWAAGYVLALGVVILVLAVAGALVLALRLADRDAVSDVLLGRMGWSSRELARTRAWEVGYAVATAVLAAALAGAVLVLSPTIIDATANVPPLAVPRPGAGDLVALLAVLVATVLLAWVVGAWRARRRRPAEVLRAG